jgi:hypothetical protein
MTAAPQPLQLPSAVNVKKHQTSVDENEREHKSKTVVSLYELS